MKFIAAFALIAATLWFSFFSSPALPDLATEAPSSCEDLQDNYQQLLHFSEQGTYRYTRKTEPYFNRFPYQEQRPFAEYLSFASAEIALKNPKAALPCTVETQTYQLLATQNGWHQTPTVSQLVAPFELRNPKTSKAILLIHGLSDSPFLMHDLASLFYAQGFTVRTLLLPGHSTAPSELINSNSQEWQEAVHYGVQQMEHDFEEVYLGGYSLGATLILNELINKPTLNPKLKALFFWAPASKVKSKAASLARYADLIPGLDWLSKGADIDFAKYESFPLNAAAQAHQLMSSVTQKMFQQGANINLPIFTVASQNDETIDTNTTLEWFIHRYQATSQFPQPMDTFIYYGDPAIVKSRLPSNSPLHLITPECLSGSVCKTIKTISHISATSSPSNPHYGLYSKYRSCQHYQEETEQFKKCKYSKEYRWGAVNSSDLEQSELPIRRLTFNPYFDQMAQQIEFFLQRVSKNQ